ncbi:helix-turn-helix transcriptional regulator [Limosilactobacillus reuteri]|uniref:helix-turn-helix domain-containing protein n=1 Tax=Limosilactobacillus reuteri TaxID=1598 RepID=UPI00236120C9|nr:helix-turn-helix transcriptional regulator [Limosilactobacillus reuteri]MDD1406492.1 helix-turn-helix transcriptional regulator [Limosilactobacillus reuteri]
MDKKKIENEKKPHNRIAELRKERELTIQQVADGIGVSNGTISRYEKGTREPKLETWIKLSDFFNVPVSYLQGLSDFDDLSLFLNMKDWLDKVSKKYPSGNNDDRFYIPENELNALTKEITLGKFNRVVKALSYFEGKDRQDEINKMLAEFDDINRMSDIYTLILNVFLIGLKASIGDKKAQNYYKKFLELEYKYKEWDDPIPPVNDIKHH